MTISYFGHSANPADAASVKWGSPDGPLPITPPSGMATGDLVYVIFAYRDAPDTLSVSNAGGQTWTSETNVSLGSMSARRFWCTFNGTWSANPTFTALVNRAYAKISAVMLVFRPSASPTWAVDVAEATGYVSLSSPWDVTATGQTSLDASTVSIATWVSTVSSPPVAALQTTGWTFPDGQSQWRNTNGGADLIISAAYKIQTSAGATGNVVNRLTNVATTVYWTIETFKDQSAAPAFYQYDWPHQLHARR